MKIKLSILLHFFHFLSFSQPEKNNNSKIFSGTGYTVLKNFHGQISKEGCFKDFRFLIGTSFRYDSTGTLVQVSFYKDGKLLRDIPADSVKAINRFAKSVSDTLKKEKTRLLPALSQWERETKYKYGLTKLDSLYEGLVYQGHLEKSTGWLEMGKTYYEFAFALKPDEQEPKEKLKEIEDWMLNSSPEISALYDKAMRQADSCYRKRDYECAKAFYAKASGMKRIGYDKASPLGKIEEINATIKLEDSLKTVKDLNFDTLNQMDANGLKQGHWINWNVVKKPNYPWNAKLEEGKYIDSRKEGIWKTYFPSGKLKSEITYKNNRPDGYAKTYFENGILSESGMWSNNRWSGEYKANYENGCLYNEFNYNKSGKRDGDQKYYYKKPCGKLWTDGKMKNGYEIGTWITYDTTGKEISRKEFKEVPDSLRKTVRPYDPWIYPGEPSKKFISGTDTIIRKWSNGSDQVGKFKNGKLIDGKDYIYNKDGILIRIAIYKNGMYMGDAPIEDEKK
jgi:antitoxin component YwqK of YwqJK toxin-antitoxin module